MNAWHRPILFLLAASTACAESATEVSPTELAWCLNDAPTTDPGCNLTDDSLSQRRPAISGNRVVWKSAVTITDQPVFLYDLNTDQLTQVTPPGTQNFSPAIDGDRIVYARWEGSYSDYYWYDIPTRSETRFATDTRRSPPLSRHFSMSGERVAWAMSRNDNWDIFLYDFTTGSETRITADSAGQDSPSLHGNVIAWRDLRHSLGTGTDVYMYDLATRTEQRITANSTHGYGVVVSADGIFWGDVRNGRFFELYEYRVHETPPERHFATALISSPGGLAAFSPYVAWSNRLYNQDPVDHDDVVLYNTATGTEVQLTSLPAWQSSPALSAEYVVWEDHRNGNADIYIARLQDLF